MLLGYLSVVFMLVTSPEIEPSLPYQGVIEKNGVPYNGDITMVFRIRMGEPASTQSGAQTPSELITRWDSGKIKVSVLQGRFSVVLVDPVAKPLNAWSLRDVLARPEQMVISVSLSETPNNNDSFTIYGSHALHPTAYAFQSLMGSVPIGGVVDWFRATHDTPIPYGYKIADGTQVNDPASPLDKVFLPNLVNQFTRGIAANDSDLVYKGNYRGYTLGGKDYVDISHDHSSFSLYTAWAGLHNHKWLQGWGSTPEHIQYYYSSTYDVYGNSVKEGNAWLSLDGRANNKLVNYGENRIMLPSYAENSSSYDRGAFTNNNGTHQHSLSIDIPRFPMIGEARSPFIPAYVGLLKIIRIK